MRFGASSFSRRKARADPTFVIQSRSHKGEFRGRSGIEEVGGHPLEGYSSLDGDAEGLVYLLRLP